MDPAIYLKYYIPRKSYKDYEELEVKAKAFGIGRRMPSDKNY